MNTLVVSYIFITAEILQALTISKWLLQVAVKTFRAFYILLLWTASSLRLRVLPVSFYLWYTSQCLVL